MKIAPVYVILQSNHNPQLEPKLLNEAYLNRESALARVDELHDRAIKADTAYRYIVKTLDLVG